MTAKLSFLESFESLGQFKHVDGSVDWFPGMLRYSPEKGLQLEYMIPWNPATPATDSLYGLLQDGRQCTLFGDFAPAKGGMFVGDGALHRGIRGFRFAIFGGHFASDAEWIGIDINFNNFQEFCFPQGAKAGIPYSDEPVLDVKCSTMRVQIANHGTFESALDAGVHELHSPNKDLLLELRQAAKNVLAKYPKDFVWKRSTYDWSLRLVDKASAFQWLDRMYDLELLFSLLLYRPVRPIAIQLRMTDEAGNNRSFEVLGGLGINSETLPRLTADIPHQLMAIRLDTIELGKVVDRWLAQKERYAIFAEKMRDDFGSRVEHAARTEYLLLLTQLEDVAMTSNLSYNHRYELAIEQFGNPSIAQTIVGLLEVPSWSDVPRALSDLRGEIAHFGKPPKTLRRIGAAGLVGLNWCLDIVVAAAIFKDLGIGDDTVERFRQLQLRQLKNSG